MTFCHIPAPGIGPGARKNTSLELSLDQTYDTKLVPNKNVNRFSEVTKSSHLKKYFS